MEKKQLKLKKETLTNLTNLNQREMEELKGGVANLATNEKDYVSYSISRVTVSVSMITWTWM
jgi:hypothetical protein